MLGFLIAFWELVVRKRKGRVGETRVGFMQSPVHRFLSLLSLSLKKWSQLDGNQSTHLQGAMRVEAKPTLPFRDLVAMSTGLNVLQETGSALIRISRLHRVWHGTR